MAVSCSAPPEASQTSSAPKSTSHPAPKDLSLKFPAKGQTRMQVVPDHLLGKDFMPGGNLADYKTADGEYQMFLLEAVDARAAAFMLLDWKSAMPEAKYIAHMGGYFGTDQGKQLYVFSKGPYLAAIIGLPMEKADAEGRRFAARL